MRREEEKKWRQKGINTWRHRKRERERDMCMEDESERPPVPLDSVMGMI